MIQTYNNPNTGLQEPIYAAAWKDRKINHIVTNIGTTFQAEDSVRDRAKVQMNSSTGELYDEHYKLNVPRNNMFFKFFQYYGTIDVHDHYRQGSLALERHWITRKWFHSFFRTM